MNKITRVCDATITRSEGENRVEGIACVFNREADLGWFTEEISPRAFDEADMSDVVLNFNHDNSLLLAGTRNGSLSLDVRDDGLFQSASIINTTQGEDVIKLVENGLIRSMSFCFSIADGGEEWTTRNGKEHRTVTKIDRLYDVSLVTFPAYPQTSAWMRNGDDLADKHKALIERRQEQDKRMKELLHE